MKKIFLLLFLLFAIEETLKAGTVKEAKLLFCQRIDGYWQAWQMNIDGSDRELLTNTKVDKRYPRISPDGLKLCYVDNEGGLFIMDLETKENKRILLKIEATQPNWSPDSKLIVFTSYLNVFEENSDIYSVNIETNKLSKITRKPWAQCEATFSSDGKEVLFINAPELTGYEIAKLNLETNDYLELTSNETYEMNPVFTLDGEWIIFSSDKDGNYDIWIMDKYGDSKKNLTKRQAFDINPCPNKDGKIIYFLSDSTGIMQVWKMNANGANLRQVTNDENDKMDLSLFSP